MEAQEFPHAGEKPQRSKAMSWFLGCLVALVVFGFLCAGGFWLAADKLVAWGIDKVHDVMVQAVEESYLPEEQVSSIKNDLGRLKDAALNDRFRADRFEALEEEIQRVLSLGFLQWYSNGVVEEAGLDADEAAEAQRTVQRFARGVYERKLDLEDDLDEFNLQHNEREELWDTESVRLLVAKMQTAVERADIPDEPFQADISREFTLLVDDLIRPEDEPADDPADEAAPAPDAGK